MTTKTQIHHVIKPKLSEPTTISVMLDYEPYRIEIPAEYEYHRKPGWYNGRYGIHACKNPDMVRTRFFEARRLLNGKIKGRYDQEKITINRE